VLISDLLSHTLQRERPRRTADRDFVDDCAGRVSGGMVVAFAEQAMSTPRRFTRVSSRFALITQNALVRRYHGGWRSKYARARGFARSSFA
jgi:hypothetical protein